MKSTSPFSPWASSPQSGEPSSGATDLQQAADLLREAATALLEASKSGSSSAGTLALQITITDSLGDAVPFSTASSGTDANLIS